MNEIKYQNTKHFDISEKKEKPTLVEFKNWVFKNPQVARLVEEKKYTWQSIYEMWYLYGEGYFEGKNENKSSFNINSIKDIMNKINNIDTDKISKTLGNVEKIMQIVSSVGGQRLTGIESYIDWWK